LLVSPRYFRVTKQEQHIVLLIMRYLVSEICRTEPGTRLRATRRQPENTGSPGKTACSSTAAGSADSDADATPALVFSMRESTI
jgi:hypothetical protein